MTSAAGPRFLVVHVVTTLQIGGLEKVVLDLVRWRSPAFDARVICLDSPGVVAGSIAGIGVPVETIGTGGSVPGRIVRLARRLSAIRPDIMHTHNPQAHLHGTWAARLAGVPAVVHTRHGRGTAKAGAVSLLSRLAWRWTSSVVCVSEDAGRVARDTEGVPTAKLVVIHNGIDIDRFRVHAADTDTRTFRAVTVGRLDPIKDLQTMLQAVREVVDAMPWFHLDIVGDGPSRPVLEELSARLGLGDHVTFLGFQDDVRPHLAKANLFLQSSRSEGVPLAMLEAMASGLAVVATDVGGVSEVVVPEETGYLVPAGSESKRGSTSEQWLPATKRSTSRFWVRPAPCGRQAGDVMRILMVTPNFPTALDRTRGIWHYETARVLARGHEVVVVAHISWVDELRGKLHGRKLKRVVHEAGIEIHHPRYYYTPAILRQHHASFLWWSIRPTAMEILRRFRPDVVVAGWVHPDGECALRIARLADAACVVRTGGSDVLIMSKQHQRRPQIIDVLSRVDAVVCASRHLQRTVASLGIPQARLHTIENGLDLDTFRPGAREAARSRLGIPKDEKMLLWVGSMVPIKGLDELLDACVILRTQGIRARLYLIGDGPLMNNLTGRVRRSGLADSVRFVGKVIHETLADWYRSANLTVLPSRSEGIPNVLYESTACGTPFVANDVGGVSEIADLHLDAVVPPGNAEAFAAAIRDRLHSGATGPRLRLPSTWYEHGLALEALFRRILIARQAPGAGPTAY